MRLHMRDGSVIETRVTEYYLKKRDGEIIELNWTTDPRSKNKISYLRLDDVRAVERVQTRGDRRVQRRAARVARKTTT